MNPFQVGEDDIRVYPLFLFLECSFYEFIAYESNGIWCVLLDWRDRGKNRSFTLVIHWTTNSVRDPSQTGQTDGKMDRRRDVLSNLAVSHQLMSQGPEVPQVYFYM